MELFFFFYFYISLPFHLKCKPFTLCLLARKKEKLPGFQISRCGAAISSWMAETWGANVLIFFLLDLCIARDCREGVSKEKEAHPSGWTLGIVWGGGGHSWPSGWLWQMQAPGLLFLNLCCSSITRQWAQEGFSYRQQVKSSVGQKRVLRDVFSFMLCFYMDLRMAESTSAFWGGLAAFFFFLPPLFNGCLVSHLLYKTCVPLQKWSFGSVGLVVTACFLVVCKITESQNG